MTKWLSRMGFALLLVVLLAFVALATWEPFWAQRDGVSPPAREYTAEIVRDEFGVDVDSQRRRGRDALFRRLVVVRGRGTRARGRDARLGNAHAPSGPDVVVVVVVVVDGTDGVADGERRTLRVAVAFSNVVPRALESTVGGDVG